MVYNVVVVFDQAPEGHRGQIAWLEDCRRRGIRVYGQGVTTDAGFTFTFEDWNLFDESDPWRDVTVGSHAEKLDKMADPSRRPALRAERPFVVTCAIEDIVVVGPRTPATERYRDMRLADVAAMEGTDPVDAMLDIAVADDLRTGFYALPTGTNDQYLAEMLACSSLLPGVSDGGAHTKFATSGRYPTELLSRVVRDLELIDLEAAHWRLSALPSMCAGFGDRGRLVEGAPADIVVYDLDELGCGDIEIAHDFPGGEWRRIQRATGYRWVLVNGEITIEDDEQTGTMAGRLLRHADGRGAVVTPHPPWWLSRRGGRGRPA